MHAILISSVLKGAIKEWCFEFASAWDSFRCAKNSDNLRLSGKITIAFSIMWRTIQGKIEFDNSSVYLYTVGYGRRCKSFVLKMWIATWSISNLLTVLLDYFFTTMRFFMNALNGNEYTNKLKLVFETVFLNYDDSVLCRWMSTKQYPCLFAAHYLQGNC